MFCYCVSCKFSSFSRREPIVLQLQEQGSYARQTHQLEFFFGKKREKESSPRQTHTARQREGLSCFLSNMEEEWWKTLKDQEVLL
jgi:hypothetical protein